MDQEPATFASIDRMLDELMVKHFEMADMIGKYRDRLADLEEQRIPDPDEINMMRHLPGARYHVATTYVRELWLKTQVEIKRLFPDEPAD